MKIDTEDDVGGTSTPAEDAPLSLRETLEAEFAKASDAPNDDGGEQKLQRARDDSGRFAGKAAPAGDDVQQQAATPAAAPAAADQAATALQGDQQPAAALATDVQAPGSWTAEAKAKWGEVPAEVRKYIAEREEQVHRQFSRNDEERNFGRAMTQTFQPYMETLRAINATPDQAVAGLLNVDNVLRKGTPEQKLEMVHEIMRSYQIPLDAVTNHQPLPQDPRLQSLQQQLQAVQQQMAQGQQQQQTAAQEEAARLELETFKANAPHLEAVRADMAQLLTSGVASSLQDAYEKAVWANPETRKLMVAQQTAAASTKQRVASARAAGSSISGAPGGVVPNPPSTKRSLRDELAANFGEAKSRI